MMLTMSRTRKACRKCLIFGDTNDLKDDILPIHEEVIKCYEWMTFEIQISNTTKNELNFTKLPLLSSEK